MNQTTLIAVLLSIVVIAGGWFYFNNTSLPAEPEGVFCTADAMQCPDGSYVGRTGPNCEFVCPEPEAGGGILPYNSGIRGTLAMRCPFVETPGNPACRDSVEGIFVNVFRGAASERVAIIQSDAQGKFEFSLPPGNYIVGTGEIDTPICERQEVVVGPSAYTDIILSCDSGTQ
jgi:hypothetical protein